MPRGDGTGPMGRGPRTGWGAGYCAGNRAPGDMNPMPGRGLGAGRGLGRRARRRSFLVRPNPEEGRHSLEEHRDTLQNRLDDIHRRLDALSAKEAGEP